ncbi:MAG TPA: hypothetical protein VMR81_06265 [Patescibacteria group bacterium]|jgi:hypothetical protein|nr:hypothetical protein [Patescibacteria group bacterium]
MDDNVIVGGKPSKKIDKRVWWTVGIVAAFLYIGFLFWLLFYSVYVANLSFVIPLRAWYQNAYWQAEGVLWQKHRTYPPFNPIYAIQPISSDAKTNTYLYQFFGTFSSVDWRTRTLFMKGYDNNIYSFIIPIAMIDNMDADTIGIDTPAAAKNITEIQWNDAREFQQMMIGYSKNKLAPLNQDAGYFFIKRYE